MTTFYSPSKKQTISVSYINGEISTSIPNNLTTDLIDFYNKYLSIYQDYTPLISSCVVYEIAKKNGLDDIKNYYSIRSVSSEYPNRYVWVVEERSRSDFDDGKEIMGKVEHSYIIDALTGEVLKITNNKIY